MKVGVFIGYFFGILHIEEKVVDTFELNTGCIIAAKANYYRKCTGDRVALVTTVNRKMKNAIFFSFKNYRNEITFVSRERDQLV